MPGNSAIFTSWGSILRQTRTGTESPTGTSPMEPNANPVQVWMTGAGTNAQLRLVFNRRAGLSPRPYDYESSPDLAHWSSANQVSERVTSAQIIDGAVFESLEALLPATDQAGFVRLRWNAP